LAALFGLAALGEVGGAISLRAVQNRKKAVCSPREA
jgi:hypothetical protein